MELGRVQRLERTLRVAYQVDLLGPRLFLHFLDVVCDLVARLGDGLESADEREAVVGAVGARVGAVVAGLQPVLQHVEVFVEGGA